MILPSMTVSGEPSSVTRALEHIPTSPEEAVQTMSQIARTDGDVQTFAKALCLRLIKAGRSEDAQQVDRIAESLRSGNIHGVQADINTALGMHSNTDYKR